MSKKIELAKEIIRKHRSIFMCPLCGEAMDLKEPNSLFCANGHCFDVSRQGYLYLLTRPPKPTPYDKTLFESRLVMNKSGFFDELTEQIRQIAIAELSRPPKRDIAVLDAGCGEGSHLARLVKGLAPNTGGDELGVGVDLSKDGIRIASREYPGFLWCVADLARSPFTDRQFDLILNVFSPSNYAQFSRMLREDGILVKVVPGSGYLKELRTVFYGQTAKETYSNEDVIALFRRHFEPLTLRRVHYDKPLGQEERKHLVNMTPLAWGTTENHRQKAFQSDISSVTIDVTVLVGRKRKR